MFFYFVPGRVAKYCDDRVCLCVCLSLCVCVCLSDHSHISGTTRSIFPKFFMHDATCMVVAQSSSCSVMDDFIFAHNGPYAGVPV